MNDKEIIIHDPGDPLSERQRMDIESIVEQTIEKFRPTVSREIKNSIEGAFSNREDIDSLNRGMGKRRIGNFVFYMVTLTAILALVIGLVDLFILLFHIKQP